LHVAKQKAGSSQRGVFKEKCLPTPFLQQTVVYLFWAMDGKPRFLSPGAARIEGDLGTRIADVEGSTTALFLRE
ncbi:hypothetical protein PJP12_29885, partial [Mycobacterium kansasii]